MKDFILNRGTVFVVCFFCLGSGSALARPKDTIGLKNFREIPASYAEATGVSARTGSIPAIYRKVASRLPVRGQVEELGSPTVLALVELAGAYCAELILKETNQSASDRKFFGLVSFDRGQDQFTRTIWTQIATDLATAFWQRPPNAGELENFRTLLADYQKESVSSTGTARTLQSACVQAGSALAFLTNGI